MEYAILLSRFPSATTMMANVQMDAPLCDVVFLIGAIACHILRLRPTEQSDFAFLPRRIHTHDNKLFPRLDFCAIFNMQARSDTHYVMHVGQTLPKCHLYFD